ncbi:hypothetical protein Aduo_019146 [Ancylostoma duodenale]
MEEAETGANIFEKLYQSLIRELTWGLTGHIDAVTDKPLIWIHCMAHKIELALSNALMEDDEGRRQQSQLYKWRAFTTEYLNRLRNFFGTAASSRRRVLVEAGELLQNAPFLQQKKIIHIRRASSEKDSILNFVRIYKKLWLALQQISHPTSRFDQQTKLRAAGFLYLLKSLKFHRYVVYQLQLLDIIAKLSKSAQLPASTIWQIQAQLDHTISTVYASAENPNEYELTKPFAEAVQCKEAIAAGRFRITALNESKDTVATGYRSVQRYAVGRELAEGPRGAEVALDDVATGCPACAPP